MGHNGVIKGSNGGNVKVANNAEFPKEWTIVSLERDCVLISGLRPKGGASDEGIPSLGGEHITLDGRINFSDVNAKYIPEKFFKIMTKGKTEENDILINKDGANTGKVAMLKKKFYKDIAINEHLFILRSKKLFVQQYLFYWLFSRFGQKQITDRITGSAQPGLSSTFIKNFLVPRPPLPEQRKIAEILETIDSAIEKTDAIIEKYKRIKQSLMQDLLTKGVVNEGEGESERWRLRDENIDKFKDSPLGRIPEEWEVVDVYGHVNLINGGTPSTARPEFWNGSIPWLSVEDFNIGKRWVFSSSKYITELGLKQSATKPLKKGMLIISARGTVGVLAQLGADMAFNQSCYGLDAKDKMKLSNDFLYYALKHFITLFLSLAYGNVFNTITRETFKEILIPLPSLPEQQRIASILSQIDEAIEKEQAYKEKLERIKKGLMEDLLTGKVRVNHLIEEEEK
ncbi:restriction endonuclease subunit S [Caldicellulosiruptor changbaiensis]|uniref:Restriction endonuclease subunit S n=1 Tax=Caldicellulosiruptor changbaiensis TaxID=1222016 RepID=A0A3T0D4F0_9FIRM|nr:restriction endonuclease subunit S [Caldicellulosiruptor changbaiensis]